VGSNMVEVNDSWLSVDLHKNDCSNQCLYSLPNRVYTKSLRTMVGEDISLRTAKITLRKFLINSTAARANECSSPLPN
jgi:hypothetical protein